MCKNNCIRCEKNIVEGEIVCKICDQDVCYQCENKGYKCDTGYGNVDIRICDENNICPVCNSDPNGEHKRWFINYLETHKECDKCKWVIDVDDECYKCKEEDDVYEDWIEQCKELKKKRIDNRVFGDITRYHVNCINIDDDDTVYYSSDYSSETDIDEVD